MKIHIHEAGVVFESQNLKVTSGKGSNAYHGHKHGKYDIN